MTQVFADVVLAVASSLAASIIAKVTVVVGVALGAVRLASERRAAVRHAVLMAAFGVSSTLPIVSILAPSIPLVEVPVKRARFTSSPALPPVNSRTLAANQHRAVPSEMAMTPSQRISPSVFLLTGWATGALLSLVPLLIAFCHMRKLLRLGRPWHYGRALARQLAADASLRRPFEVLLHETLSGPVTCGVLMPSILLPSDAQTWPEDDLRRAIIHELEHVRRSDWLTQSLVRVVCACYWFHPLFWVAWRRLSLEAERACDDAVLRLAVATAYADQLVGLAERMSTSPSRYLLTMANRADLTTRVVAVLDNRQQRGRAGKLCLVLVWAASAALVTTISPLRIVTAAQMFAGNQRFTGSLIDPVGKSIPDATFSLSNVSMHRLIEVQSDRTGRFIFSGIPPGEYLLTVRKFGFDASQERITIKAGQDLNRTVQAQIGGIDDTVEVYSSEASAALPALPSPLPSLAGTSQPYTNQADLDRCGEASMFCRVLPPHQIGDAKPIYPAKLRERGVGGRVLVEGRIGRDGLIKDLRTLAPVDPDFTNATFDALRRWQFTAMLLDGVPIEVPIRVTADFVVR